MPAESMVCTVGFQNCQPMGEGEKQAKTHDNKLCVTQVLTLCGFGQQQIFLKGHYGLVCTIISWAT